MNLKFYCHYLKCKLRKNVQIIRLLFVDWYLELLTISSLSWMSYKSFFLWDMFKYKIKFHQNFVNKFYLNKAWCSVSADKKDKWSLMIQICFKISIYLCNFQKRFRCCSTISMHKWSSLWSLNDSRSHIFVASSQNFKLIIHCWRCCSQTSPCMASIRVNSPGIRVACNQDMVFQIWSKAWISALDAIFLCTELHSDWSNILSVRRFSNIHSIDKLVRMGCHPCSRSCSLYHLKFWRFFVWEN